MENVIAIHEYVGCLRLRDAFHEMLHELAPLLLVDSCHGEDAWVTVAGGLREYTEYVRDRNNTIKNFIKACQQDVKNKQERIDSDKLKKTVEQNVLITFLNNSMEVENDKYFTNIYTHR